MKLLFVLIATLCYVLALLLTYSIHAWYFRVDVVFYAAVYDALVAAVILFTIVQLIPSLRRRLNGLEHILVFIIWLLGGYAFAISGPAVLDRSLSVYIIEKLVQRGGGIRLDKIEQVFTQEYIVEHRLIDVRLTEQLESGTIEIVDGCVLVTEWGQRLANLSRFLRRNFLPRNRLLLGEYTDDLTDPFRNSVDSPGYACSQAVYEYSDVYDNFEKEAQY
jgi:hypothetical protein